MRYVWLVVVLVLGVLLVGCSSGSLPVPKAVFGGDTRDIPRDRTVIPGNLSISPGKVWVGNLKPGSSADIPIVVANGKDYDVTVTVTVREPDYVEEGYERLPDSSWLGVPGSVGIRANDWKEITVTVRVPKYIPLTGKTKVEVWISFKEDSAKGSIRIELCSRLLLEVEG